MQRDKFGRPETSVNYGNPEFTAVEWDSVTAEKIIYLRGDYDATCLIQKIDMANGKITWAFGAWDLHATLVYGSDRMIKRG